MLKSHVEGTILGGQVDQHVTAAAQAAHPGLHRADGDTGSHRRVHGIAAFGENPGTDLGRFEVLTRH